MQTSYLRIPIQNPNLLPNFPDSLNISETEALTCHNWKDLFERAVLHNVPNYAIAIVPLKKQSRISQQHYNIYDGVAFRNYLEDEKRQNRIPLDPLSRQPFPLNDVKYMSVSCFNLSDNHIQPIPLEFQEFKPLLPRMKGEVKRIQAIIQELKHSSGNGWDTAEEDYLQSLKAQVNQRFPNKRALTDMVKRASNIFNDYFLDGLNFHTNDDYSLSMIQELIGNIWGNLLDETQQKIWHYCAKQNDVQPSEIDSNRFTEWHPSS